MRALRRTVAAAVAAAAFWGTAASADDLLILSAFPTEQAVLLSHAQPVTEVGVFNGRRFFRGTIAGQSVVLGLTGIGLVNAEATASAVLDSIEVDGIIFSGVAGGDHHIGDVIVPDHWTEGANSYPVDAGWYATARARAGRRRGRLTKSAIRWGRALLDARPELQRHRIDAEAADGALPHLGRRRLEDERWIRWRGEPRRRRQLGVELARAPPGVAEEEARAPPLHVGGRGLEQPAEHLDRRGQVEALGDPLAVRHARVVAEEEEAALRLDRAARPQHEAAVAAGRWIEHHRVRGAHLGRAIHHEAERALRAVLAEEHHRAHEVRITQLRHREQQGGSEGAGGIHGRMVAVARRLVNPTRPGARAASRRRPPNSLGGPSAARALSRAALLRCPQFNARAARAARRLAPLGAGLRAQEIDEHVGQAGGAFPHGEMAAAGQLHQPP